MLLALGKITPHSYLLWACTVSLSLTIMSFGKKQFYGVGTRKDYALFLPAVSSHSVLVLAHQEFRWKKFFLGKITRHSYLLWACTVSLRLRIFGKKLPLGKIMRHSHLLWARASAGRLRKSSLRAARRPARAGPRPPPRPTYRWNMTGSDKGAERKGIRL